MFQVHKVKNLTKLNYRRHINFDPLSLHKYLKFTKTFTKLFLCEMIASQVLKIIHMFLFSKNLSVVTLDHMMNFLFSKNLSLVTLDNMMNFLFLKILSVVTLDHMINFSKIKN